MDIAAYLDLVRAQYASGQATEHSYRPALHALFQSIDPALTVVNEPKKTETGMPDFLFQRDVVPVGWAEAKDIDKDVIRLKGYSVEQRKRYERAYPNLLYTNGVDFEFIREGTRVHFVSIADFMGQLGGLQPLPDRFDELARQLKSFAAAKPISVTSAAKLAELMAAKAAIIKDEIDLALKDDPEFRTGLGGQFKSFKANLLPALEPGEFADIYAETITYGLFAARFHDDDLTTFSRAEALEKLPASNPFLKGLFEYIAGPALPTRLTYIVDDLVAVMRASDPHSLFENYGKFTARNDPFVHFYEDFLAAYNPKKRKSRGVWYTPEPVVDFIVRAVDEVLKSEFGLADGLADTSKVTVDWDTGTNDPKTGKAVTVKKEMHKVQILDPATGTGTFLAKAVQLISDRVKARAPGKWSGYVEQDLLPRLHGFELLMASYAMCHMKLDMQLTESGYKPSANPPRLSVWLTNALEPAEREVRDLFFQPLAEEARGASEVKRQSPIMCVIGNPPYSVASQNRGPWILGLIESYKVGLAETKINLDDDYIKFIRFGQHLVEQNGSGILAFISNNSYLDGVTHRQMRKNLLECFDSIHILDLHGSAMKRERAQDGSADDNVFDIMQGVSLIIASRTSKRRSQMARVWHGELLGKRSAKYEALWSETMRGSLFTRLEPSAPFFFFAPKNFFNAAIYEAGFSLRDFAQECGSGVKNERDKVCIKFSIEEMRAVVSDFQIMQPEEIRAKYHLGTDSRDWTVAGAKADASRRAGAYLQTLYRPFDTRHTYYTGQSRGFSGTPGGKRMARMTSNNLSILITRQLSTFDFQHSLIAATLSDICTLSSQTKETGYVIPLYLDDSKSSEQADAFVAQHRRLNIDPKLYATICAAAGIDPANQAGPDDDFRAATGAARPSEVKVFDYIYGVLHSPAYRATFAEFLKIDFPRIPYPPSPEAFAHVSEKGEQLRRLHLMEAAAVGETPYPYHGEGGDVVASGFPKWESSPEGEGDHPQDGGGARAIGPAAVGLHDAEGAPPPPAARAVPLPVSGRIGRVYINKDQFFHGVPQVAWAFHIGGYQPAQKWLKDRRGRALSYDDIGHYQTIVKILVETDRIMREIELPLPE